MNRRNQSPFASWIEAATNVALGFVLALVIQALAYPAFGISTTIATDSSLAALFTLASLLRSYLVRRAFEAFGRDPAAFVPSIKPPAMETSGIEDRSRSLRGAP